MKKIHCIHTIFVAAVLLASSILCSCAFIGLGDATDLTAPTVTITAPASMASVKYDFIIEGTAFDNVNVTALDIEVTTTGQKYRYNGSSWQRFANSAWTDISGGTWAATDTSISWSVPVSLNASTSETEYTFVATVQDAAGNNSSSSTAESVVVIDSDTPTLTVNEPELTTGAYSSVYSTMNAWSLQDSSCYLKLVNGTFTLGGTVKDNSTLSHINLVICGEITDSTDVSYTPYYTAKLVESDYDAAKDATDDKTTYTQKTVSSLRNWSVSIAPTDFPTAQQATNTKTIMQVYTDTYDTAGHHELASKGYFCYYPAADTPWVVIPFGYESSSDAEKSTANKVYPGYSLQGQSYDDDGIGSITINLYNSTDIDITSSVTVSNTVTDSPTYAAWSITAPTGNGTYHIKVSCKDSVGTTSTELTKYFAITDTSAPVITLDSAVSGLSAIGDANGNFTLSGTVSDNSKSVTLKMARIQPGANYVTSQVKYLASDYTGWDSASTGGFTDSLGNTVYRLSTGTATANGANYSVTFAKEFSIFDFIGTDGSKETLTNQLFILMANDGTCSSVVSCSLTGDVETPVIKLTKLCVKSSTNSVTEYSLPISSSLPAFNTGDTVCLLGTWSDNSTTTWTNYPTRIGSPSIAWNSTTITGTISADGSWTTEYFTPPSTTSAVVTASLKDYGGNTGSDSTSFSVESVNAQLVRISSSNTDGAYKAGDVITITTEFNKKVTISDPSSAYLVLNNGKKAAYSSGSGTLRHSYTYTINAADTNTAKLNVNSIYTNSGAITWTDSSTNTAVSVSIPSGCNLSDLRTIAVDTESPKISSVTSYSPAGSYTTGNTIFIKVQFSEAVTPSTYSDMTLTLNSGTTKTASFPTVTSAYTMLFSYTVASGDTASPLAVSAFNPGSGTIVDGAGNSISTTLSTTNLTGVIIDTTAPAAPTISGLTSGKTYYANPSFTVSGESGATIQYSLDGGSSWSTYSTGITLSTSGSYTVCARQTDAAGNTSATSSLYTITLDTEPLLTRISSTKSDGSYSTGTVIPVVLTFRKAVTVTMSTAPTLTMKLSSSTTRYATFASAYGTASTTLTFNYTVADGDAATALDVSAINWNGSSVTIDGSDVSSAIKLTDVSGSALKNTRSIAIITGVPAVESVSLSGTILTVVFDRAVYKSTGSILLKQNPDTYVAPAVLTAADYNDISSYVSSYYSAGTNGSDSTGTSDTSTKYILNSSYTTSNAAVTTAMKNAGALTVTIPFASSSVTRSGTDLTTFTIPLTGSYALPVKGAAYSWTIEASAVKDSFSNSNVVTSSSGYTLNAAGVEAPVIRITKSAETISSGAAIQPLTAAVQMDCQTPGAVIYYNLSTITNSTVTLSQTYLPTNGSGTVIPKSTTAFTSPAEPTTSSTKYSATFNLGPATEDYSTAYKYLLRARAYVSSTASDDAYETAYRTVVRFVDNDSSVKWGITQGDYPSFWLRGGDSIDGGVGTPDFPFNWDSTDYSAIRLMSTNTTNTYYWVTWKLNVTAYVGLLAGNVPSDAATKGPSKWCWAACAWVPLKAYYPVYPGESLTLTTITTDGNNFKNILGQERGILEFKTGNCSNR